MKLYFHLAWDGIRKNRRLYVPYLLTGVARRRCFTFCSHSQTALRRR